MALHPDLQVRDRPRRMHEHVCTINMNAMRGAVIHPNGKVEREFKAESYVENFLRTILTLFRVSNVQVKRMSDGALTNTGTALNALLIKGSTDLDGIGILMGSGNTAPVIGNYALNTRLASDVSYSVLGESAITSTDSNKYFDLFRTVTAEADGIAIREMGCTGRAGVVYLMAHDLIDPAVALDTGEARILRYRFHFTAMWPQFLQAMYAGMQGTTVSMTATSGSSFSLNTASAPAGNIMAEINSITLGNVISSTETPTAWNAHVLAGIYGTADFYHFAQVADSSVTVNSGDDTAYFETSRDFVNISGAVKTVREYALYAQYRTGASNFTAMIHAGTLPAPVSVGIDEGIRITYRFSIET
jgi:hypothetical protein